MSWWRRLLERWGWLEPVMPPIPRIDIRREHLPAIRICPDCSTVHSTHPAVTDSRCKPCRERAWEVQAKAQDEAWNEGWQK